MREAIEVDPNIPLAYCLLGQTLAMAGDWEQAVEQLELALGLAEDPDERWPSYIGLALSCFVGEQYVESVGWAERSFIHSLPLRPTRVSRPHIGARAVESTATDDASHTVFANDDGIPVPRKRTATRTGT